MEVHAFSLRPRKKNQTPFNTLTPKAKHWASELLAWWTNQLLSFRLLSVT